LGVSSGGRDAAAGIEDACRQRLAFSRDGMSRVATAIVEVVEIDDALDFERRLLRADQYARSDMRKCLGRNQLRGGWAVRPVELCSNNQLRSGKLNA
jgi:hypothetical protein